MRRRIEREDFDRRPHLKGIVEARLAYLSNKFWSKFEKKVAEIVKNGLQMVKNDQTVLSTFHAIHFGPFSRHVFRIYLMILFLIYSVC